jgi:formylglycine-generating enzyme required for sulfatase activity
VSADGDADADSASRPHGWDEGLARLSTEGVLDQHIALLRGLSLAQLDRLVHTGSPPREPAAAGSDEEIPQAGTVPVWIAIPAGRFPMGADDVDHAKPVHEVSVPAFGITRDPVTNAQYAAFVEATGRRPPKYWYDGAVPEGKAQHPVVGVSWDDANAYCAWLTEQQQDGHQVRLLTEAEWEYAARGEAGREYPWGKEAPDKTRCNFGREVGDTTPVGSYPDGATPEGVRDLAGNVLEWVQDHWKGSYTGAPADGSAREDSETGAVRVIRGGSWLDGGRNCRCAFRFWRVPDFRFNFLGFRCARVQS